MKRYARRAAFAVLLAAPVLAVPVSTASAAPAWSVSSARSCSLPWPPWHPRAPYPYWYWSRGVEGHGVEALIGNLSPAPGSTVAPGATISFLIADEKPFPTPLSGDALVTVNGASVTPTAGDAESGVPITYANPRDRGSRSTKYEVPFSFALPVSIGGNARIRATARDADGNQETICWTLTLQTTALPSGAIGGLGAAVLGGLALIVVQFRFRRRRGAIPTRADR